MTVQKLNGNDRVIGEAVREGSPKVGSRKAGHVDDYAQRTAAKAWSSPDEHTYREEQARKAQMKRERVERGPTLG